MKNGTHTEKQKEIKMDAQGEKRASLPSAGSGQASARPGTADAPQGAKRARATPPRVLARAKQAALAIEAAGTLLAKALDRMQAATDAWRKREITKAERDERWQAEWHEIQLVLNEHADALLLFLTTFCNASCFRHLDKVERERERAERRAETMARLDTDGKLADADDGEEGAS